MKAVLASRIARFVACVFTLAFASVSSAQSGNCTEIANDVGAAVAKDPSKVLMVVEDALVINESCAADIVKAAIVASKADAALAGQIVQTAVSVAPKMAGVINDAAASVVPGLVAAAPQDEVVIPVTASEKNPKNPKNPVIPTAPVEEDFFVPSTIRGVFLIQPPASGPLPCRCDTTPVSPSNSKP